METGALISKINSAVPGAFLQKSRFGKSELFSVWVDIRRIREVAVALKHGMSNGVSHVDKTASDEAKGNLDWLENMSVSQVDDALVITYFLRSFAGKDRFAILRGSIALNSSCEVPSVSDVWPMATSMEKENSELFGLRFIQGQTEVSAESSAPFALLPEGWHGFPLRKDYVFPREVFGIEHSREVNQDV